MIVAIIVSSVQIITDSEELIRELFSPRAFGTCKIRRFSRGDRVPRNGARESFRSFLSVLV